MRSYCYGLIDLPLRRFADRACPSTTAADPGKKLNQIFFLASTAAGQHNVLPLRTPTLCSNSFFSAYGRNPPATALLYAIRQNFRKIRP